MKKHMKQTDEQEKLKKLERMMINISHLTGQHYGQEDWKVIVKAGTLDIWLYFDKLLQADRQALIKHILEEADKKYWGTLEDGNSHKLIMIHLKALLKGL